MIVYNQIVNMEKSIAVIGLGYVGISLAISFAKKTNVIGFDIDKNKINQYINGIDLTNQVGTDALLKSNIIFTLDETKLKDAIFHIITVPTPIYEDTLPNLEYIIQASEIVGRNLSRGSVVVYESTVYPGVTEDVCIPILETASGLICGIDFKVGYSPERINPEDQVNKLESIVKIVSGIDIETLDIISKVYELIIKAGVYRAESIKVAEAAKVIENVQRDVNIGLINEISIILHSLDIDTKSVFDATATKWNALNFNPGLVGGHCIGVDSYFLTYVAQNFGLYPEIILSGRKINEYMPQYICDNTIKRLLESGKSIKGSSIAIFGFSFKENCSDIRNTKIMDIITELEKHGINIKVVEPFANPKEILDEYGITIYETSEIYDVDGIIFAVAHKDFLKYKLQDIKSMYLEDNNQVLIDVKGIFDKNEAESLGYNYWSL